MGAAVLWTDVDTVVARHNVQAYRSGQLAQVDVDYLESLSAGAVPYIAQLAADGNKAAQIFMEQNHSRDYWHASLHDLRSWNWADWLAGRLWE